MKYLQEVYEKFGYNKTREFYHRFKPLEEYPHYLYPIEMVEGLRLIGWTSIYLWIALNEIKILEIGKIEIRKKIFAIDPPKFGDDYISKIIKWEMGFDYAIS
jgi:hypothetical protein